MKMHHLAKPFIIGESFRMSGTQIRFANLVTDKIQHQDSFYNIKYGDEKTNEMMYPYYGAKRSDDGDTYGGYLPLMNEFITSVVLHTISSLRDHNIFEAPRVLIGIEDDGGFRLFSKMLESFKKIDLRDFSRSVANASLSSAAPKYDTASFCYLAGLSTAMQEIDPNFANYGTVEVEGAPLRVAKIDSNTLFPTSRIGHGGIYFNHLKRKGAEELMQGDRDSCNFGAYVAQQMIFDSMRPEQSPDLIRFVGGEIDSEVEKKGCLKIKEGCGENFKQFMIGVRDFIEMPDNFIDFLKEKLSREMLEKNPALAMKEEANIDRSCNQFFGLKRSITEYFKNELQLFAQMFPEEAEAKSIWDNDILRKIIDNKGTISPAPSPDVGRRGGKASTLKPVVAEALADAPQKSSCTIS